MAIKLVIGLGNPGQKYVNTRHNIGRQVVESLRGAPLPVDFITTDRFMNESGIELAQAAKYKRLAPEEILVVLDEFQIPLRKVSILTKGSSGGHNGLKSIIESMGTENIPRMRIGIGPLPENTDPANFVLERFQKEEHRQLALIFPKLENAVTTAINQGLVAAMNKYNSIWIENA